VRRRCSLAKELVLQPKDEASEKVGITEQTYYRWRREYGGLQVEQGRRLKELEKVNSQLKKFVADLSLDKAMLKEAARGNF
jgi:putative transposase